MASLLRNHLEKLDKEIFLNPAEEDLNYEFPSHDCYGLYSEYFLDNFGLSQKNDRIKNRSYAIIVLICVDSKFNSYEIKNVFKKFHDDRIFSAGGYIPDKYPEFCIALMGDKIYKQHNFNSLMSNLSPRTDPEIYSFGGYVEIVRFNRDITDLIKNFEKYSKTYDKKQKIDYIVNYFCDRYYKNFSWLTPEETVAKIMGYEGVRRTIAINRYVKTKEIKDLMPIDI